MRELLDFLLSPFGFLILIGILGQFFGSEKRQKRAQEEARRRRQQRREQEPTQAGGEVQRTDAEDIARRIREMMGLEKPAPAAGAGARAAGRADGTLPVPSPEPRVRARQPERGHEQELQWQVEGVKGPVPQRASILPVTAPGMALPGRPRRRRRIVPVRSALLRNPTLGVAALLALGPPRSLAPYEQDPLSCFHLRKG
ncbi:MAG: hypothetical protein R3F30_08610 [Planctomycetota bacterium]